VAQTCRRRRQTVGGSRRQQYAAIAATTAAAAPFSAPPFPPPLCQISTLPRTSGGDGAHYPFISSAAAAVATAGHEPTSEERIASRQGGM